MEEVLDYEGLVYSVIQKYHRRHDLEDLYQVGMIGLMDACIKIKISKNERSYDSKVRKRT